MTLSATHFSFTKPITFPSHHCLVNVGYLNLSQGTSVLAQRVFVICSKVVQGKQVKVLPCVSFYHELTHS
uniref:Uncharacterized protein n=2 Tax=Anguilla anguilla TaxID=7936 RepID=A0A0E9ST12_ANGAN